MRSMPGISLATAQARLDAYIAAEIAVLSGQEYEIAGRRLRRPDLGEIRRAIAVLNAEVKMLGSARRSRRAVPRPSF